MRERLSKHNETTNDYAIIVGEASISDISVHLDMTEPHDFLDSLVFSDYDIYLYTIDEETEYPFLV